jgi:hypothetical protein
LPTALEIFLALSAPAHKIFQLGRQQHLQILNAVADRNLKKIIFKTEQKRLLNRVKIIIRKSSYSY